MVRSLTLSAIQDQHTERMPKDKSQLGHLLPLLAKLKQSALSRLGPHHLGDPLQDSSVLFIDGAYSSPLVASIAHDALDTTLSLAALLLLLLTLHDASVQVIVHATVQSTVESSGAQTVVASSCDSAIVLLLSRMRCCCRCLGLGMLMGASVGVHAAGVCVKGAYVLVK